MTSDETFDLWRAFPGSVQDDAAGLISILKRPVAHRGTFSVVVRGETLTIPHRIYDDLFAGNVMALSNRQREMLACLMTRHHSGFVRQKYLEQIMCLQDPWIPPFVVQLIGEYVVEILEIVNQNLRFLDASLYRRFLLDNEVFFAKTKQRVQSYWDCYHRMCCKENYVGFQISARFDELLHTPVPSLQSA